MYKKIVLVFACLVLLGGCFFNRTSKKYKKLDTSDLICDRIYNYEDYIYEEQTIMHFNSTAIISNYEDRILLIYQTVEVAKEKYNQLMNDPLSNHNEILDGKSIITSRNFNVDKVNSFYNKTKEQMRKIYENNYNYNCK